MLDVSNATRLAYQDYSTRKELTITIQPLVGDTIILTDDEIISQSLSLTEKLETEDSLHYIGCNASVLQFKCKDLDTNVKGGAISCTVQVGNTDEIPLFHGIIDEATNSSHEQTTMSITAYDRLYSLSDTDVRDWYDAFTLDWVARVTYCTLYEFRTALFNYLHLEQVATELPNDNMRIYKSISNETISALELIRYICQINARFGKINRQGKFEYIKLQYVGDVSGQFPNSEQYPNSSFNPGYTIPDTPNFIDKSFYSGIDFENYEVKKLNGVVLRRSDGSELVDWGEIGPTLPNIMEINNNPLVWDYEDSEGHLDPTHEALLLSIAENIYLEAESFDFTPLLSLKLVGLPYLETGDCIVIQTKKSIIRTYILERTLTGSKALMDNFGSFNNEYYPVVSQDSGQNKTFNNIATSVNAINGNIANINTTLTNLITYSTQDIVAGTTPLATGTLYLVYE